MIEVEVVYALPQRQEVRKMQLADAATAADAVRKSGLVSEFPEIAGDALQIGVFGKLVAPEHPLRQGDRVELYRPLVADAKLLRRRRTGRRS